MKQSSTATYHVIEVSQLPSGDWSAALLPTERLRLVPRTGATPQGAVTRLLDAWLLADVASRDPLSDFGRRLPPVPAESVALSCEDVEEETAEAAREEAKLAERAGTTLQLGRAENARRMVGPSAWTAVLAIARALCLNCATGEVPEMRDSMLGASWWHDGGQTLCAARLVWLTVRAL